MSSDESDICNLHDRDLKGKVLCYKTETRVFCNQREEWSMHIKTKKEVKRLSEKSGLLLNKYCNLLERYFFVLE